MIIVLNKLKKLGFVPKLIEWEYELKKTMITVSIIGGSGYAGGELLTLLLNHSKAKVHQVTSNRFAGEPIPFVHPNLRGKTSLSFSHFEDLEKVDFLFISLPNGESMRYIDRLMEKATRIIDLGADFRLKTEKDWLKWYKIPHLKKELLGKFIYGLPELNRDEIKKANYVAGPGCEATVTILTLWPIIKNNLIDKEFIVVDAKMSSSQAGNKPTESSHHPERAGVVRSYMPVHHRHTVEVEQELSLNNTKPKIAISATAIELVRGLLVTIHTKLKEKIEEKAIWKTYRQYYQNEPFIRIVTQKRGLYRYPEPKILQGTNYCDIGFAVDKHCGRLVLIGAIDNLTRGTAGQAIQCMNLMCGFKETLGLEFPGLHPV